MAVAAIPTPTVGTRGGTTDLAADPGTGANFLTQITLDHTPVKSVTLLLIFKRWKMAHH